MFRCFVSVRKVILDKHCSTKKPYSLTVGSLPSARSVTVPARYKSSAQLRCSTVWCLKPDAKICVVLSRETRHGDSRVAVLLIPFSWLPQERVIRQWFPMKVTGQDWSHPISASIKIHIDTHGKEPFTAPPGNLLVTLAAPSSQPAQPTRVGCVMQQQMPIVSPYSIQQFPTAVLAPQASPTPHVPVQGQILVRPHVPIQQAPVQYQVPVQSQVLARPQVPVQYPVPVQPQIPVQYPVPVQPQIPSQSQISARHQVPVQQASVQYQVPVQPVPAQPQVPVQQTLLQYQAPAGAYQQVPVRTQSPIRQQVPTSVSVIQQFPLPGPGQQQASPSLSAGWQPTNVHHEQAARHRADVLMNAGHGIYPGQGQFQGYYPPPPDDIPLVHKL